MYVQLKYNFWPYCLILNGPKPLLLLQKLKTHVFLNAGTSAIMYTLNLLHFESLLIEIVF